MRVVYSLLFVVLGACRAAAQPLDRLFYPDDDSIAVANSTENPAAPDSIAVLIEGVAGYRLEVAVLGALLGPQFLDLETPTFPFRAGLEAGGGR